MYSPFHTGPHRWYIHQIIYKNHEKVGEVYYCGKQNCPALDTFWLNNKDWYKRFGITK